MEPSWEPLGILGIEIQQIIYFCTCSLPVSARFRGWKGRNWLTTLMLQFNNVREIRWFSNQLFDFFQIHGMLQCSCRTNCASVMWCTYKGQGYYCPCMYCDFKNVLAKSERCTIFWVHDFSSCILLFLQLPYPLIHKLSCKVLLKERNRNCTWTATSEEFK